MGSNGTATATTGGPRVITYFDGPRSFYSCIAVPNDVVCGPEISCRLLGVGNRRAQAPTHIPPPLPSVYTYQARCSAGRGALAQVPNVLDPEPTGELQAPAHAGQATTDHQTYPERPPVTKIPTKKSSLFGPDGAPFPLKTSISLGPQES